MIERNKAKISASPADGAQRRSWGNYPAVPHRGVVKVGWRDELESVFSVEGSVLAYGLGRSYGDSCLNEGGVLLDTSSMRRFISFDEMTGILRCEAGVSLADILALAVPRGWFLPTSPGTKFVTVGGAIANDVHGKNHHVSGTFGRHVLQFELLRSSGERLVCSPTQNADFYRATIGGLGLTGLILWAELQLRKVSGPYIDAESIRFGSLDEFFAIAEESDEHYEFTMAFVDALATGKSAGRGIFTRGNHAWQKRIPGKSGEPKQRFSVPLAAPGFLLNRTTLGLFNTAFYWKQPVRSKRGTIPYDPFFYPLDSIQNWNRLYGPRGFVQHQCVVPPDAAPEAMRRLFGVISSAGEGAFLAVLKKFGDIDSPGMMSFPRPGVTLALDFPVKGHRTWRLLDRMDDLVVEYGGAVYPAKDARMSPETFEASFPRWREFAKHVDPRFSSSFWRRVTGQGRAP
jgi:FAD/FMN-containing dehydrogenase